MSRSNTPKFGIGYGWSLGENPGTVPLDEMRLKFDAAVKTDFSYDPILSNGLHYFYWGGTLYDGYGVSQQYDSGQIDLANNTTNYVYRINQIVEVSTTGFPASAVPLAIVVTLDGVMTSVTDVRPSELTATQTRFVSNNTLVPTGNVGGALDTISDHVQTLLNYFDTVESIRALNSTNGAQWIQGSISETITLSTIAAFTDSSVYLLPGNAEILSVVAKIEEEITGATDWALGDAANVERFAVANATLTAGTPVVGLVHIDQTGAIGPRQTTAAKLRITTSGSLPTGGIVKVTVFYNRFAAPV